MIIYISRSLQKTPLSKQYLNTTFNRYSKLTCAISTLRITLTPFKNIFLSNWILLYGIPDYVITRKGPPCVQNLQDFMLFSWA